MKKFYVYAQIFTDVTLEIIADDEEQAKQKVENWFSNEQYDQTYDGIKIIDMEEEKNED